MITLTLPTTSFQWQSWDCFALVNWIRAHHNLPTIDASWVYQIHPTVETFHKDSLLQIVPKLGTRQQCIKPLHILLMQSSSEEYTLGTALKCDRELWVVLMGENHAHCIPIDRLPIASITAWLPNEFKP